jgi:hypothetical protein
MEETVEKKSKSKVKKIFNVIGNIVTYLFIAVCILAVIATITAKKSPDGGMNMFGYQMRVVVSQSMEWPQGTTFEKLGLETEEDSKIKSLNDLAIKAIPLRSMVFVSVVPQEKQQADLWYSNLRVGDVLTFQYGEYGKINGQLPIITHRITKIQAVPTGGYRIELKGDNKGLTSETQSSSADTSTQVIYTSDGSVNYVIGKVVGHSHLLGSIITIVQKPVGIVCIVIIPCVIIIILEIIKMSSVISGEKKKKLQEEIELQQAEKERQDNEIELLKQQLAALQQAQTAQAEVKEEQSLEISEKVESESDEQTETLSEDNKESDSAAETEQSTTKE